MIQTIRNALPNITADQEMLIGESCLTLTNEERTAINRINFTEYSRTETRNGKLIADIVSEAVFSAKQTGAIGGAGIGAIGGAGMGYLLNDKITGEAVSSGAIGGVLGGAAGYKFGSHIWEKMERDRLIADITNSPEYRAWIFPKFKEVFPVLGQFMKANEWNNISLECPIAQDWMTDPIQTPDGCMYERRSIEDWLAQWDRLWTPERLAELTDVQRSEARLARSPLRNRDISLADLTSKPNYYAEIFKKLKENYNDRVSKWHRIYERRNNPEPQFTREENIIVNFYRHSPEQRMAIANETDLAIRANVDMRVRLKVTSLLLAASEPPDFVSIAE